MRLLSLDYDPVYGNDDVVRASFSSDISVFDFDVVIWDPKASFQAYASYSSSYRNLPSLSESRSVQIQADAKRRLAEFREFVDSGRTLVVIVSAPQVCYVDTGQRTYSGTGRNRATTTHVDKFDLMSALPLPRTASFSEARGSRIEFNGGGPLVSFLRKHRTKLEYAAVIANCPGTPLAHVAGTERHIATLVRSAGGGHLALLPAVNLYKEEAGEDSEVNDEDESVWADDAFEFQGDLLEAIDQLSGTRVMSRPSWMSRFSTGQQRKLETSVVAQQAAVESARAELARLQGEKERAESRDQLYLGTGRALELEVRRVLELLGGKVSEPEPGRDDWRVEFPEGEAVVEVKGVTKSAAEKYAAQLEKWVANAMEETGTAPKGILVVNTWRETPLDQRSEKDFPDQMIPYCKGRQHCLVTGLQLFVIQEEVEAKPGRAAFWRNKLLTTSGRLNGATAWRGVITAKTDASDLDNISGDDK